jgi:hypothetical protein
MRRSFSIEHLAVALVLAWAGCGPTNPTRPEPAPYPYRNPVAPEEFAVAQESEVAPNRLVASPDFPHYVARADLLVAGGDVFVLYFIQEAGPNHQPGNFAIRLRKSTDAGATFSVPRSVRSVPELGITSVHLSLDECGVLTLWVEEPYTGLFVAQSPDLGNTFTDWRKVPIFDRSQHTLVDVVARPPCGWLMALVVRSLSSGRRDPYFLSGSVADFAFTLSPIPRQAEAELWGTAIARLVSGELVHAQTVLLGTQSRIHLYASADGGRTFEPLNAGITPAEGFSPHLLFFPYLLARPGGGFYLLWRDLEGADAEKPRWMAALSADGNTFSGILNVTGADSRGSGDAYGAVDANDRLWVAYEWCDPDVKPGIWDGYNCELRLRHSDPAFTEISLSKRVSEIVTFVDPRYKPRQNIRKPLLAVDTQANRLHGIWLDSRFTITPSNSFITSLFHFAVNASPL